MPAGSCIVWEHFDVCLRRDVVAWTEASRLQDIAFTLERAFERSHGGHANSWLIEKEELEQSRNPVGQL